MSLHFKLMWWTRRVFDFLLATCQWWRKAKQLNRTIVFIAIDNTLNPSLLIYLLFAAHFPLCTTTIVPLIWKFSSLSLTCTHTHAHIHTWDWEDRWRSECNAFRVWTLRTSIHQWWVSRAWGCKQDYWISGCSPDVTGSDLALCYCYLLSGSRLGWPKISHWTSGPLLM